MFHIYMDNETYLTPKNANKYTCEKCDFNCSNQCDWNRHLATRKHNMKHNETYFTLKNANKYNCEKCDFNCSKQCDWNRHLVTRKHNMKHNEIYLTPKNDNKYNCEKCDIIFKSRTTLYRHKKKCSVIKEKNTEQPTTEVNELFTQKMVETVMSHNTEFMTMFMNKMMETMPQLGNNNHNINSNNNTNNFNIQMFLNEHCKNAMNLTDFIQSLPITNKTYDDTIENGLTKTITNMMVNGLNDLDILERPIHCTDTKRKTIYVKESDKWERDNELIKILNGITEIVFKQRTMIKKWQEANEGWETIEKIQLKLTRLISNLMTSIEDDERETNKIIRSISNKVYLDNDTKKIYV